MIEFAPNPTGPSHIGTLRSYAVAWLEAKRRREPVFVRFDASEAIKIAHKSQSWADRFLKELDTLEMSPDHWQYFTDQITTTAVPSWASVRAVPDTDVPRDPLWGRSEAVPAFRAYYPLDPPRDPIPSWDLEEYVGDTVPMKRLDDEVARRRYYFATQFAGREEWIWDESLVALLHMHMRGVTAVVRCIISANIYEHMEKPAKEYFGVRQPEVILTPVVVGPGGVLRKSNLQPGAPGTVGWGISTYGAARVRERILASAEGGGEKSVLPY